MTTYHSVSFDNLNQTYYLASSLSDKPDQIKIVKLEKITPNQKFSLTNRGLNIKNTVQSRDLDGVKFDSDSEDIIWESIFGEQFTAIGKS